MLVLRKQKVGEYYDMARTVGIGKQDFGKVVANNNFYIDKTLFIKEWWENDDEVTLITRPRRFGKTLNMSMVEQFFSVDYAGRGDLFKEMNLWKEEFDVLAEKNTYIGSAYQHLQVISQDKQKRMEYEAREKAVRDYNQGILEAEQRGEARINKLNSLLIKDKRYNDLERSTNDSSFQKQLMSEYGI